MLRSSTIWLVIAALAVVMSFLAPNFFTVGNLRTVVVNMTHVAILAFGLTFVFLGGGFDLSQGAVLILAATLLVGINPEPLPLVLGTFLLILGISTAIGTVNGYLIGIQRLNPFVVTLGMRTIIGSIIFINAANAVFGMARQSPILEFIGLGRLVGFLPVLSVVLIVVLVICWYVVRNTPYGRRILTVGTSVIVARFSGLQVERLQMSTYMINGLLAGLAGILVACKTSYLVPSLTWHYDFDAITACALGGISLAGGRGTILNALSGVVLLVLIDNSMVLLGVPPLWQPILKGIVLLIAIVADMQTKRNYA
jgi:ribose/xylose/arabinose/galactoside ABC-type transport system permease subunit